MPRKKKTLLSSEQECATEMYKTVESLPDLELSFHFVLELESKTRVTKRPREKKTLRDVPNVLSQRSLHCGHLVNMPVQPTPCRALKPSA